MQVQTADALGTQMVSAPSTSTKPLAAAGLELLQARIGHPAPGRTTARVRKLKRSTAPNQGPQPSTGPPFWVSKSET